MSEHILTGDIKKYLNRTMKPAELLKADDHLAECDACLMKVKDFENPDGRAAFDFLQASAEKSEHLSYEQFENYIDEKSDRVEREIADVHFQVCAECRAELNGLIEMRNLIETDLHKQIPAESAAEKSIPPRAKNFFAGWSRLRFAFAAIALLLLSFAAFWLLRRGNSGTEEIAVTLPSPNSNSPAALTNNSPSNADPNTLPVNNANQPNRAPDEDKTDEFPGAYQTEIRRALAANRLSFPAELNQLGGQNGELMGGGTESVPFALESPLGKIIQTDRPQFRWRRLDGADGYIVNVYDANFNRVTGSARLSATSWQIDRPLARNKIYVWQVTALKDSQEIKSPVRPAPDAKFKVIDASKINELARLSRQYKTEHLGLGILYANAGLFDEAAREFQKELAKNPNSGAARKFLQDLRRQK